MKTRACLKYYLSDRSSLITKLALFYLARVYDLSAHPVTRLELKCNSLVLYPSSRSNLLQKLFDYSKRFNSQDELQSLENCFDTFGPLALTLFENINCDFRGELQLVSHVGEQKINCRPISGGEIMVPNS